MRRKGKQNRITKSQLDGARIGCRKKCLHLETEDLKKAKKKIRGKKILRRTVGGTNNDQYKQNPSITGQRRIAKKKKKKAKEGGKKGGRREKVKRQIVLES